MMTVALITHDHHTGRTFVHALPLVAEISPRIGRSGRQVGEEVDVTFAEGHRPPLGDTNLGVALMEVLGLYRADRQSANHSRAA